MKHYIIVVIMFFNQYSLTQERTVPISYDEQIATFKSLGYEYVNDVNKEMILRDVYEAKSVSGVLEDKEKLSYMDEAISQIESNPYSVLYYTFGWRSPNVKGYNYTNQCIWFDLEFFDSSSQYKWFMERMGEITNGEIIFDDISIETDEEKWEWIKFKVNGMQKKWKLEKPDYIADHFIQRFSYLPNELETKGKYTYYSDGGQQFVIDYATPEEQEEFIQKTKLNREWLGQGNHFREPPK